MVCLYRPPSVNIDKLTVFINSFNDVLSYVNNRYPLHKTIITGDFNIDLLTCSTPEKQLRDMMDSYNFSQKFRSLPGLRVLVQHC